MFLLCVLSRSLSQGDPAAFLPIVSFTLTSFSPQFAEQLMAAGLELTGKSDLRFTDALYKASHSVVRRRKMDRSSNLRVVPLSLFLAGAAGHFPLQACAEQAAVPAGWFLSKENLPCV